MVQTHLWYAGFAKIDFDFDLAAMPSYKGVVTAKMHDDTFEIPKGSKHPDAAFKAMSTCSRPRLRTSS
jgi:multiple sugar transport system substrate-binding protein